MHLVTTDIGLVLKAGSLKERDGLIVIATLRHGVVHALATGFQQPAAKLRAHLQPGSVCEVSWVTGVSGTRLVAAVCTYAPKGYSRKYLMGFGRYLLKFVMAQHPDEGVTEIIKQAFDMAPSVTKESYRKDEVSIIHKLLQTLGYVPHMEATPGNISIMVKQITQAVHSSHL